MLKFVPRDSYVLVHENLPKVIDIWYYCQSLKGCKSVYIGLISTQQACIFCFHTWTKRISKKNQAKICSQIVVRVSTCKFAWSPRYLVLYPGSGRWSGRCWEKIWMQLLEVEEDPEVVGRWFRCSFWKRIRMLLFEDDSDAVAGMGRGCWKMIWIPQLM